MKYRELLKLYKSGKLDEETRSQIEADIEKQDAISDYLYEEAEIPALDEIPRDEEKFRDKPDENQNFVTMIQRSIRNAFIKMGVIAGISALAVLLFAVFVLPPAVSMFYYNPTKTVSQDPENPQLETQQMSLDLAVYTELFLPGSYRDYVYANPLGYGKYSISVPQTQSYNGQFTSVNGELVRNRLQLYNPDLFRLPTSNAFIFPKEVRKKHSVFPNFIDYDTGEPVGAAGKISEAYKQVDNLLDDQWYLSFLSFTEILDYEKFYQWFDPDIEFIDFWCAAYMEDEEGQLLGSNIGFMLYPSGQALNWDQEKYPELSNVGKASSADHWPDMGDAKRMQTHFISLLRYMQDHEQFMKMMEPTSSAEVFPEMIESVERDGLRLHGIAIVTRKETLLKLRDDPLISYIYTRPSYY